MEAVQDVEMSDEPLSRPTPQALEIRIMARDPEVVAECCKYPEGAERERFVTSALRIGVLALRQASGALDVSTIRDEADRLLENLQRVLTAETGRLGTDLSSALARYFDPESGQLVLRLHRLTEEGGTLDSLLRDHLGADTSTMAQTLAQHLGESSPIFRLLSPEQRDGLLAHLTSSVDALLRQNREAILNEFSLDKSGSALSRFLDEVSEANGKLRTDLSDDLATVRQEFSLDNENGALARLIGRVEKVQGAIAAEFSTDNNQSAMSRMANLVSATQVEIQRRLTLDDESSPLSVLKRELTGVVGDLLTANQRFHEEVHETLAKLVTRREEAARGTAHGGDFQDEVAAFLSREAQRLGDVFEDTSHVVGIVKNCKVGDGVVTLGADSSAPTARIVVEAKASQSYTLTKALEEMETARTNRSAQIGIFVFSRGSAPDGLEPLARYGHDLVAVWDETEPSSDVVLRVAMSVARALAIRENSPRDEETFDFELVDRALASIAKEIGTLQEIMTSAETVKTTGDKIKKRAELIAERVNKELEVVTLQVDRVRAEVAEP